MAEKIMDVSIAYGSKNFASVKSLVEAFEKAGKFDIFASSKSMETYQKIGIANDTLTEKDAEKLSSLGAVVGFRAGNRPSW